MSISIVLRKIEMKTSLGSPGAFVWGSTSWNKVVLRDLTRNPTFFNNHLLNPSLGATFLEMKIAFPLVFAGQKLG